MAAEKKKKKKRVSDVDSDSEDATASHENVNPALNGNFVFILEFIEGYLHNKTCNLDETKKAIEWINNHHPLNEDDDDDLEACLLENWRYTFTYRNQTSKDQSVEEILKMWPSLNCSYGFFLVRKIHHIITTEGSR